MQAHSLRSFLAKNCIFTHLSFEIETEKKFPLLLPSHNCIIITMFSFQGTWWVSFARDSMKYFLVKSASVNLFWSGGDKRDRTADLLNAIQALSQLSYTPIFTFFFRFPLPIESPAKRVSIGEEKSVCKEAFRLRRNAEFANRTSTKWWAKMDSNHRPHDYQSCALASWAIGPFCLLLSKVHILCTL